MTTKAPYDTSKLSDEELARDISSLESWVKSLERGPTDELKQRALVESVVNLEAARIEWARRMEAKWTNGTR